MELVELIIWVVIILGLIGLLWKIFGGLISEAFFGFVDYRDTV